MRLLSTASAISIGATGILISGPATAQQANTTPANVNVLNLLSPFLGLNATPVGQSTLQANLAQGVALNQNSSTARRQLAISDKTLPGSPTTVTLANGSTLAIGPADNLAGGLPLQAAQSAGGLQPLQPVGGLGTQLGAIYQTGIRASTATTGPLAATYGLLTGAYSFTSSDLGVAKNYFANGAATNPSTTPAGYVPVPAVAPAGYTLPTFNGLPNTRNSVLDLAYGVTNTQAGQDVYGSSRPVQVAPTQYNIFDPTALNGLATNPSFPSGHTNYAFTDSVLLAMLVPSQYQSQLARGAEYGESRIVLGVHYPLDIIASRAFSAYDLAQAFTNPLYMNNAATTGTALNLPTLFTAAQSNLQGYLSAQCGAAVATCSTSAANLAGNPYVPSAANQALYQQRLTYGLPTLTYVQAPREAATAGGPDASILLAPLYGGSTAAAQTIAPGGGMLGSLGTGTINQILVNTEGQALSAFYGTPLSYWTRIDLYSAAGYFGNVTGSLALAPTDRVATAVAIGSGGALEANGTITGATTVSAGGTLSGNGTVAGVNVLTGGTLAPGASAAIGTLAVSGPLVFAAGSTYAVRATPTQADQTVVSGTATLGGANVAVSAGGNFLPRTRYNILSAGGGVSGTFGGVTTNLAFLTPSLSYDSNDAYLNLARNDVSFTSVAATANQRAVGTALTLVGMRPTSDAGSSVLNSLFTLSAAGAQAAYDQLSGEGLVASQNTNVRAGRAFTESVGDQIGLWRFPPTAAAPLRELADLPARRVPLAAPILPHYRVWASGFGGAFNIDGNAGLGTARERADFFGGEVGADTEVAPGLLLGGALGGSGTDFSVNQRATSGQATGFHASIYGAFFSGANYLQSVTAFSDFSNSTNRSVGGFNGFGLANERAAFGSTEIRERVEAGHSFGRDAGFGTPVVRFTPFVALEIAQLSTRSFSEYASNGVANVYGLRSFGQSAADVPGFVGLRLDGATSFGGFAIRPVVSVAYLHEFAPQRNLTNGFISLPGATFLVQGARPARNAAQTKLGAETSLGRNLSLFADFDGEFSGVAQVYGGKGGLRYVW